MDAIIFQKFVVLALLFAGMVALQPSFKNLIYTLPVVFSVGLVWFAGILSIKILGLFLVLFLSAVYACFSSTRYSFKALQGFYIFEIVLASIVFFVERGFFFDTLGLLGLVSLLLMLPGPVHLCLFRSIFVYTQHKKTLLIFMPINVSVSLLLHETMSKVSHIEDSFVHKVLFVYMAIGMLFALFALLLKHSKQLFVNRGSLMTASMVLLPLFQVDEGPRMIALGYLTGTWVIISFLLHIFIELPRSKQGFVFALLILIFGLTSQEVMKHVLQLGSVYQNLLMLYGVFSSLFLIATLSFRSHNEALL